MYQITPTRREALGSFGAVLTGSWVATSEALAFSDQLLLQDESLDEALQHMQQMEPMCHMGLSTHAPMGAEALCTLGYPQEVMKWVKGYRQSNQQLPTPGNPINPDRWQEALGPNRKERSWNAANARWGDWREFFTKELAEKSWQDVVKLWTPRLAPGLSGAATHGIIRTAHAVRGLSRKQTPQRMGELARGLAYWASSYETLPVQATSKTAMIGFAAALQEVPLYREAFGKAPSGRNIVEVLRTASTMQGFAEVIHLVKYPANVSEALSALTATFTRVYLRYGKGSDAIPFIHAITGPYALRRLAPVLDQATLQQALPYAWQTAAAIFTAYVPKRESDRKETSKLTSQELAERAVKSGDEHAIKFTDVMLNEYAIAPDPVYLAAAEDAIGRL